MQNILTPLAKSVLIPLGFTTAVSTTDAAIKKKIFGLGMHPGMLALHCPDLGNQTTNNNPKWRNVSCHENS